MIFFFHERHQVGVVIERDHKHPLFRIFGALFGWAKISSNPPDSIATTMLSKDKPRAALSASFFSAFQRKSFITEFYSDVPFVTTRHRRRTTLGAAPAHDTGRFLGLAF